MEWWIINSRFRFSKFLPNEPIKDPVSHDWLLPDFENIESLWPSHIELTANRELEVSVWKSYKFQRLGILLFFCDRSLVAALISVFFLLVGYCRKETLARYLEFHCVANMCISIVAIDTMIQAKSKWMQIKTTFFENVHNSPIFIDRMSLRRKVIWGNKTYWFRYFDMHWIKASQISDSAITIYRFKHA